MWRFIRCCVFKNLLDFLIFPDMFSWHSRLVQFHFRVMPHNLFPSQFTSTSYLSFSAGIKFSALFLLRHLTPKSSTARANTVWLCHVSRGWVCVLMEWSHMVLSTVEVVDWRVLQTLWGCTCIFWCTWMIFLCKFFHASCIASIFLLLLTLLVWACVAFLVDLF